MTYVLLINREVGLAHSIYPVCGKSTKCYGSAVPDFARGGMAFRMSFEDYERDKWDILGNRNFQQTWVPEFVEETPIQEVIEISANGNAQPPILEPAFDDMRWRDLCALGRNKGVFKVGMKREALE